MFTRMATITIKAMLRMSRGNACLGAGMASLTPPNDPRSVLPSPARGEGQWPRYARIIPIA